MQQHNIVTYICMYSHIKGDIYDEIRRNYDRDYDDYDYEVIYEVI